MMRWLILLVALILRCHGQDVPDVYMGWVGKWVVVDATAYSPHDPHDGDHWSSQDHVTAAMRDWRINPYGIAVPMRADASGRRNVPAFVPYGTKIIIPRGYGYLDRLFPTDRIFEADDTGGRISTLTAQARDGVPVIDLRFKESRDALRWAGPDGRRRLLVFVVHGPYVPPQPVEDRAVREELLQAQEKIDFLVREAQKRAREMAEREERLRQEAAGRERTAERLVIFWALAIGAILLMFFLKWLWIKATA